MSFEMVFKESSVRDVVELYSSCGVATVESDRAKLSAFLKQLDEFSALRLYALLTAQERGELFAVQGLFERLGSSLEFVKKNKVKEDKLERKQLRMRAVSVSLALDELLPKPKGSKFEAVEFAELALGLKSANIIFPYISNEQFASDIEEKFNRCYRLCLGVDSFSVNIYYDVRYWLTELLKTRRVGSARVRLVSMMESAGKEKYLVGSTYNELLGYIERRIKGYE